MNQRQHILAAIRRIPKGKVSTYGAVARAAGFEGAARQVAWALHGCGPDVPWQRVVGAQGKILLTGAPALEQRLRLRTEGVTFRGDRVAMDRHEHRFSASKRHDRSP
jgi:methylated-DNA-protein-cysteine methyltransferase-like protein